MIQEGVGLFGGTVSATVQVSCNAGGGSGGGDVNQCTGQLDEIAEVQLSLQGKSAKDILFACGFGECVGSLQSGDSKECLLSCVQPATEYSPGCAGCWAAAGECLYNVGCWNDCYDDSSIQGDFCVSCLESGPGDCAAELKECTGN